MLLLSSAAFFFKIIFLKKCFRNTIGLPKSLDPDQDRRSVGPDLGPNCLQGLEGYGKNRSIRVEDSANVVVVF